MNALRLGVDASAGAITETVADHLGQVPHELIVILQAIALDADDGTVVCNSYQQIATFGVQECSNCLEYGMGDTLVVLPILLKFAADDTLKSRGKRYIVARDNVVLELGLFVSRLGRKRVFVVLQRTKEPFQLPSDLHGISVAEFDWPADQKLDLNALQPVLGPTSVKIQSAIQKAGTSEEALKPLSGGMVFLALLLRQRTHSIHELAAPFRKFEELSARLGDGDAINVYSEKAAKYACQCLQAMGMVEPLGGDEFALTQLGLALLGTEKLRARYANVFELYQSIH